LKVQRYGSNDTKGSRNALSEAENSTIQYIKAVQQLIRYSLERLYNMELALHGIKSKITIVMPQIASVNELRKWDISRLAAEVVSVHRQSDILSPEYLREHVLYLNDEELALENERAKERAKEKERLLTLSKSKESEPEVKQTNLPQGGGAVRVKKNLKNKQMKTKSNSYGTPKNATESTANA
jgi:hypothetical protein